MNRAIFTAASALAFVTGMAPVQSAENPLAQLRTCSLMQREERIECLDKLARSIGPPAGPTVAVSEWVVSQTTSPVDYAPIATAVTSSREVAGGSPLQLTMRCRGERSELAVSGPAISGRAEDYVVSYSTKGGQPVQIAATTPAFGTGIAFKADPRALFQSLPSHGELVVYIASRLGAAQQGTFSLVGLEAVRTKIATACKWPAAIAKPNS
ncbi:hypothetical protein JIR23_26060 [Bradyrhizobium diazoefficiens]|nr:hypothetical protein [Bradyrhizobium diazoefficiens]QQN62975.1 hypothetical protein JIR23_26060 [Bradyrhizobium diazoefficiens]